MEAYQRDKHPDLENSQVEHLEVNKKKERVPKQSMGEMEASRRQRKSQTANTPPKPATEKARLTSILQSCLSKAVSLQTLQDRLAENGLTLYHRGKTP